MIGWLRRASLAFVVFAVAAPVAHVLHLPNERARQRRSASWTPATLPADWTGYRAPWEAGHALAALWTIVGLAVLICG